jgi:hypothetical protein
LPDQIVDLAFRLDEELRPFEIGIEEDTLNEWLKQPLRAAMLRRRRVIPFEPKWSPRNQSKTDFIQALQPFFKAGEITFARPLDTLVEQLVNFTGYGRQPNDAANALAYCLLNRPGSLIYEDFDGRDHVFPPLRAEWERPVYLAANAKPGLLSAVLVQWVDGILRVLTDWLVEGEVQEIFEDVAREASMFCGKAPLLVAGPRHFGGYNNVGLVQAAKAIPLETRAGRDPLAGRGWLAAEMSRHRRGFPCVEISENARWTLNALAGGYARPADLRGLDGGGGRPHDHGPGSGSDHPQWRRGGRLRGQRWHQPAGRRLRPRRRRAIVAVVVDRPHAGPRCARPLSWRNFRGRGHWNRPTHNLFGLLTICQGRQM